MRRANLLVCALFVLLLAAPLTARGVSWGPKKDCHRAAQTLSVPVHPHCARL